MSFSVTLSHGDNRAKVNISWLDEERLLSNDATRAEGWSAGPAFVVCGSAVIGGSAFNVQQAHRTNTPVSMTCGKRELANDELLSDSGLFKFRFNISILLINCEEEADTKPASKNKRFLRKACESIPRSIRKAICEIAAKYLFPMTDVADWAGDSH